MEGFLGVLRRVCGSELKSWGVGLESGGCGDWDSGIIGLKHTCLESEVSQSSD